MFKIINLTTAIIGRFHKKFDIIYFQIYYCRSVYFTMTDLSEELTLTIRAGVIYLCAEYDRKCLRRFHSIADLFEFADDLPKFYMWINKNISARNSNRWSAWSS
jgi:hypothetical protein